MGERRIGDRRAPEKGVIKVPFKDAVIYLVFSIIIIISVSANIVLASLYNKYRTAYESEIYYEEDVDSEQLQEDVD